MNNSRTKPHALTQLLAPVALACLGWAGYAGAEDADAKIEHEPVEAAPSGVRVELAARIRDAAGVGVARVYFKAADEANYLFVRMQGSGEDYAATLPAPSVGVGTIEYLILVRNRSGMVYKTQVHAVEIEDGEEAIAAVGNRIQVFTELDERPDAVHGFTDNIVLDVTGLPTLGTIGMGVAAAAAIGGVVVATRDEGVATQGEDDNRAPGFADGGTLELSVPEGTQGAVGAPVAATDPDGDVLSYSLTGKDAGLFGIDGKSGQLSVRATTKLDFETRARYAFQVVASDGGLMAARTVDLAVSDVNEAPAFPNGDLALNVLENATGDIGEPAAATDPDGDVLSYSLTGKDAGLFGIDGKSGQLSVRATTNLDFEARASYAFEVAAADAGGLKAERTVGLAVTNVNEAPAFPAGKLELSVPEGTQGDIGAPAAATDPDGDVLSYSLTGKDAGLFGIDGKSGQLSVRATTKLDFETRASYAFEVVAADAGGLKAGRTVGLAVTNEGPAFQEAGTLALSVLENDPGDIGEPAAAEDPGGGDVAYRLEGADAGRFEIDGSGQLSVRSPGLDYEDEASYAFKVAAADAGGLENRRPVVVEVENAPEAPEFPAGKLELSVPEGTQGDIGEPAAATDPDGDVLSYSLTGKDAGLFGIDGKSGQLSVRATTKLDFETRASYAFEVVAADAGGLKAGRTVGLAVTNEGPAFQEAGTLALSVLENDPGDIGEPAAAEDPGGGDVAYRLEGADAGRFEIDGSGQLSVRSPGLDYEDEASYAFKVAAADAGGLENRRPVVVEVENAPEAPEFPAGKLELSVPEGTQGDIGEPAAAADPDGDVLSYSLTGKDAGLFGIDGKSGQLSVRATTNLDFETRASYAFEVVAADAGGLKAERTVGLAVTNVNEAPAFPAGKLELSVPEGTQGDIGAPAAATDPDGDVLSYSLTGKDAGLFGIDGKSGQLSVRATTKLDFETRASYAFEVAAADAGGLKAERTVGLAVTNVNEAPAFPAGKLELSVPEGTQGGIGAPVAATDPDGDVLSYSLTGKDAGPFGIDGKSGQLSVRATTKLDLETRASYAFEVVAADAGGLKAERTVGLAVTNVNEAPEFPAGKLELSVPEGTQGDIGEPAAAADPDGDVLSYSLTGKDAGLFGIDGKSGQLSVRATTNLDFETRASYAFEVVAADAGGLKAKRTVAVVVTEARSPGISKDWRALVALYNATDGDDWTDDDNWSSSTKEAEAPTASELDSWHGVTVSDGRVVSLDLGSNELKGSIPKALGDLSQLKDLDLSGNRLTGSIPSELGDLSDLEMLTLEDNRLTGSIPRALGDLSDLEVLRLDDNRLTGELPSSLTDLDRLDQFHWGSQVVADGQTPLCAPTNTAFQEWVDSIGTSSGPGCSSRQLGSGSTEDDWRALVALYNATGGADWTEKDNWSPSTKEAPTASYLNSWHGVTVSDGRVVSLDLGSNELKGSIPRALGDLSQLKDLDLSGNRLTGSIPSELDGLANLEKLYLHRNRLTGSVPLQLGTLSKLEDLDLSGNRLTGELPSAMTGLDQLDAFYFHSQDAAGGRTPLCAPRSEAFQTWLRNIGARSGPNCGPGAIEDDWRALVALYNATSGADWTEKENWSSSTEKAPSASELGSWHGVTVSAGRVVSLDLGGNELKGSIPTALGDLSQLKDMDLSGNRLAGLIPPALVSLSKLEGLDLSGSRLTGAIPPALGDLPKLENLDLSGNRLTGSIPPALGGLSQLKDLDLSGNRLAGELPSALTSLDQLAVFRWGSQVVAGGRTRLCAPTDAAFQEWLKDIETRSGPSCGLGAIEDDWRALVALYRATGGDGWTEKDKWSSSLEGEAPTAETLDSWYGVDVSAGRVVSLDLESNELKGSIPTALGDLSQLEVLDLSGNRLTGELPSAMTGLDQLDAFYFHSQDAADGRTPLCVPRSEAFQTWLRNIKARSGPSCGLGAIEDDWRALVALYNATDGTDWTEDNNWSSSTEKAPSAAELDLWHGVTVSGGRVVSLDLAANNLTGSIPPALGDLPELKDLDLSGNRLAGSIPYALGSLPELKDLDLSGNRLTGSIPPALGDLSKLEGLDLSGNRLAGELPSALTSLDQLAVFRWGSQVVADGQTPLCAPTDAAFQAWLKDIETSNSPNCGLGTIEDDWRALVALYNATGGDGWTKKDNWTSSTADGVPSASELDLWHGVDVSAGRVVSLDLDSNELTGSIPSELGGLSKLEELDLSGNLLTGSIPYVLGGLSKLERLYLDGNRLTGKLPSALTSLDQLDIFRWDDQDVADGETPLCAPRGKAFQAWLNGIKTRSGRHCGLGTIEDDWRALVALYRATRGDGWTRKDKWSSSLEGEAPTAETLKSWYGVGVSDGRVVSLDLGNNRLEGSIPPALGDLASLERLSLGHNELTGSIPSELGDLASLKVLDLHGNKLTGSIPSDLGGLASLEKLVLDENKLTGSIPSELGDLASIKELHLHNNELTGSIPSELDGLDSLEMLFLGYNQLTGSIPSELGDLASLEELHLHNNDLTGSIPLELTRLDKLKKLDLSGNQLTGELPSALTSLNNMSWFHWGQAGGESPLCAPTDETFQDWLQKIETSSGPNCSGRSRREIDSDSIEGDWRALVDLYIATDGGSWTDKTGWSSSSEGEAPTAETLKSWYGVDVSDGRVTSLDLSNNGLEGPIPPALGDLSKLKELDLSGNTLTGSIPSELGGLFDLVTLALGGNELTGKLPSALTSLYQLADFRWGSQDVADGETPLCAPRDEAFQAWLRSTVASNSGPQCGLLSTVEDDWRALVALYNATGGTEWDNDTNWSSSSEEAPTPEELRSWHGVSVSGGRVTSLDLSNNGLEGPIPPALGDLSKLEELDLSGNKLTDSIPSELGGLSELTILILDENQLTDSVPSELGDLSKLKELDLSANQLMRSLPIALTRLHKLKQFRWSSQVSPRGEIALCVPANEVFEEWLGRIKTKDDGPRCSARSDSGTIEDDWRALVALYNETGGDSWTEKANWSPSVKKAPKPKALDSWYGVDVSNGRVVSVKLKENNLNGPIPSELGGLSRLEVLNMTGNGLTGTIPWQLGDLSSLRGLYLGKNNLTGKIPRELGGLSSLRVLDLYGNGLKGKIPTQLGGLSSLRGLVLSKNNLTGKIPTQLGSLSNLEVLGLSQNNLTGSIPSQLGGLSRLRALSLADNGLTGTIPTQLGSLSRLQKLYLSQNNLTGTIPSELGNLSSLHRLQLDQNRLGGSIPPQLGSLSSLRVLALNHNTLAGTIPPELGNLSSLEMLWLSSNMGLKGSVPTELGNLSNLRQLNLEFNALTDALPSSLMNLKKLELFYVQPQLVDIDKGEIVACIPKDNAAFWAWAESIPKRRVAQCAYDMSSAAAPRVEDMAIVSDPGPDGVYAAGEIVEVTVRFDRPVTVSGAPRLRLGIGGKAALADLAPPRGEAGVLLFRYAVASGDRDLDGVSIAADALQLNGGAVAGPDGAAALGLGEHAVEDDAGHVVDTRARAAERAVLEDALAAQGRAHLASAVEVIGARFRAGPAAPLGLAGGSGRAEGPRPAGRDAGAFAGARGFDAQGGPSMAPGGACDRRPFGVRQAGPACGRADGASLGSLFGRRFAVSLGARGEGSPASGWTLWGANDARAFRGDAAHGSYDGGLRSFYLGVDGRLGEDWLAGVALARSRGETGYGFEVDGFAGDGMLRTRLNAVHPYLRGRLASGLEVWGVAGLGFGAASLERDGAARTEASGLGLGLGAFGVRQGLADFGALSLSLLADAGFARLWTGDGPPDGVAGGLSASVGRLRVGVEGEHALALPGGGSLRPFWQASGRYDGGDGLPGGGLELAGGARYRSERLEGEVRARWLAAHSASSIEEFGASANLRVRAGADGLGLAASLAPRWGAADFGGVEAMWREDALRAARAGGASRRRPDREPWALEGRLEYGVALPRAAGVLTPFGELRLAGESTLRQRWGVRLDRAVGERSLLGVEFGAARVDRPLGGSAGAASVAVEARF